MGLACLVGADLVADGQGEPVGDGQLGVGNLGQVPGVGVGGPREAHVDVDGAAVLRVHPSQRSGDSAAPVASCAQHGQSVEQTDEMSAEVQSKMDSIVWSVMRLLTKISLAALMRCLLRPRPRGGAEL